MRLEIDAWLSTHEQSKWSAGDAAAQHRLHYCTQKHAAISPFGMHDLQGIDGTPEMSEP